MKIVAVIPTINESESIGKVIEGCYKEGISKILVIDGDSTDDTQKIAKEKGAEVLVEKRKGYGRAYLSGFDYILKNWNFDLVFCLDGDGTYPPSEIKKMLPLINGTDFVIGNRLTTQNKKSFRRIRWIGNHIFSLLINFLYNDIDLVDYHSGAWLIKQEVIKKLHPQLKQEGMPLSIEIKLLALTNGYNVKEVPIRYKIRKGESKLSSIGDTFQHLRFILKLKCS